MSNELDQKISQLLDNEMNYSETISVLHELGRNSDAAEKYKRYSIISHTLKTSKVALSEHNLVKQISAKLEQEPVVLVPNAQKITTNKSRNKVPLAVAASLILMVGGIGSSLIYKQQSKLEPARQVVNNDKKLKENHPIAKTVNTDSRFNDYLEAHVGSLYAAGSPRFQPPVSVVNYEQQ